MRCTCGQELVEEELHTCPACGATVDPTGLVDHGVEVEGRRLPIHAWEGEVLLRGAGWTAGLHAASLCVSFSLFYLRRDLGTMSALEIVIGVLIVAGVAQRLSRFASRGTAIFAALGCAQFAMVVAKARTTTDWAILLGALGTCALSLGILRRSRVARALLTIVCLCWLAFLLLEMGNFLLRPQLTLRWLTIALCTLPPLFCLAAMWSRQGRAALEEAYRGQPLASLSTVRMHAASPLGWASIGFVALSWVFASLWFMRGLGWVE